MLAKKFIDKNTQLTLQAYREQIESCKEQIDGMHSLSNKVWSVSQEPDPIQLLQVMLGSCPPTSSPRISSWLPGIEHRVYALSAYTEHCLVSMQAFLPPHKW